MILKPGTLVRARERLGVYWNGAVVTAEVPADTYGLIHYGSTEDGEELIDEETGEITGHTVYGVLWLINPKPICFEVLTELLEVVDIQVIS